MYNLFGIKEDVFNAINSDTILFAEMAAISIVVNVILVFIGLAIQKNVMFKLEVENETKIETVSNSDNKITSKDSKNIKKTRKTVSKTSKKDKDK